MNEGEKDCKRLGFSTIVLHVEEGNENARRFYKKRVCTAENRWNAAVSGQTFERIKMNYNLMVMLYANNKGYRPAL